MNKFLIKCSFFLLPVVLLLLGTSCGDSSELTRKKAAALISTSLGYPYHEKVELDKLYPINWELIRTRKYGQAIPGSCIGSMWPRRFDGKIKMALTQIRDKGLITITHEQKKGSNCITTFARIDLTDVGCNYLLKESDRSYTLKASDIVLDQVTGIIQTKDSPLAVAEYTESRKLKTPFFSMFDAFGTRRRYDFDTKRASFTLYDNGWRVNNPVDGEQSFSGTQESCKQSVKVSSNVEEHKKNSDENSTNYVSSSTDNKQQVTIDKKYIGTWIRKEDSESFEYFFEIKDSVITFKEFTNSIEYWEKAYIDSISDNGINVRLKAKNGTVISTIKIDKSGQSLLLPRSLIGYLRFGDVRNHLTFPNKKYDKKYGKKYDKKYGKKYDGMPYSKIKTFPIEMLEGKWIAINRYSDGLKSEVLEISKNGIRSEEVYFNKKNKISKYSGVGKYNFDFSFYIDVGENRFYRQVADIQPEKLTIRKGLFGSPEQIFVPFTGQSHVQKSNANSRSNSKLNNNQIGIINDLLLAYKYELDTINLVADNADYAVLAWAAYGGHDALDLAKQRGFTPMKSVVDENFIFGDTVATLFTHENGRAVLAFRGTTNSGDWLTNILGTLFNSPLFDAQVEGAEDIAREVVKVHPNIVFVGHSLGGRLAQIGRLVTGNKAVIFNSAPIGATEFGEVISAKVNKPTGSLIGFRGPQDPLGAIDPSSGFRDVIVENIYRAESLPTKIKLSEAWVRIEQNNYFHGAEVLSNAMQLVRGARDQGWLD